MHKIAVITPVWNAERFVEDCVVSVAKSVTLNMFEIEHWVVDDCSSDKSWQIIENLDYPHLQKIRLPQQSGGAKARNIAVSQTDAEFIFCLDADDVIFQNTLRILFQEIQRRGIDWIYGDFLRTDEQLRYLPGQDYYGHPFTSVDEVLVSMLTGEHFFQQNSMYRKSLYQQVSGFDEGLGAAQDFDLFLRFLLEGHLPGYTPTPLYLHRFHEDNLSKRSGREQDPELHLQDTRNFYLQYTDRLRTILSPEQIQRIEANLKV